MNSQQLPRIVIAGVCSGVGKSSIATGLMVALKQEGMNVQGFKIGPDYIEPSYHTFATGHPSRNLDTFLLGKEGVKKTFCRHAARADISIIEGVMGLFDGKGPQTDSGSTAEGAKLIKAPVILVVDAQSMARSVAALVKGFLEYDPALNLKGVILNRVGGGRHARILKEALAGMPVAVVGAIPKGALPTLADRHLGLVPVFDGNTGSGIFNDLGEAAGKYLDLDLIQQLSREGTPLPEEPGLPFNGQPVGEFCHLKIGYAWDPAFCFYYRDALDLLGILGAQLIPFSPLYDDRLPPGLDGLIIGGGFPEMHTLQLSLNQNMQQSIREFSQRGKPIYAECGGLMYLCDKIVDFHGNSFQQLGLIPARTIMEKKLQALGYYRGSTLGDGILGPAGTIVKGHEFHYSRLDADDRKDIPAAVELKKDDDHSTAKTEGYSIKNIYASYLHQHWAGAPQIAREFLRSCLKAKHKAEG